MCQSGNSGASSEDEACLGLVGRYLCGLGAVTVDQSNVIGYLTIQGTIACAAVTAGRTGQPSPLSSATPRLNVTRPIL